VTATANRVERRLVLVVGAVVFVDTMFYAAIAPLLPELAKDLHLSKLSAGALTASYAAGTLIGAIPGGVLSARVGPKKTVFVGLALLAVSTLAFGWVNSAALLDVARFMEGLGGAFSWAGGIAWIVAAAPVSRRGALIGGALAAAIVGALFGPVIGTVAAAIGRPAAFSTVVVLTLALMYEAARLPAPGSFTEQGLGHLRAALHNRGVVVGMWLVALPAIASGCLTVLGPLRLHDFGATAAAIGGIYLLAAAIEAVISPAFGSLSDRRGRVLPLRVGLVVTGAVLLCFTLPTGVVAMGAVVIAIASSLGAFWAPAMALLADAADSFGLDQGLAAGLMNLAWAAGQIVGGVGGGAIAKAAGDGLPMTLTAALCAVTLVALPWRSLTVFERAQ
jgi:MFS family permease